MIKNRDRLPQLSTGHAVISSAYLLNAQRILQEGGRELHHEQIAFLDLSSLGLTTLRLLLRCRQHPKEILLCDMFNRQDLLEKVREELVTTFRFQGKIQLISLHPQVPDDIYNASLIISPIGVPNILDIKKAHPGTLIVGPSCFGKDALIERFLEQEDILFTVSGVLRLPHPVRELAYRPRNMEDYFSSAHLEEFNSKDSPYEIPACAFSSLLAARFPEMMPTVGIIDGDTAFQHYEFLKQSDCQGAGLHVGSYVLPEQKITYFRQRFGL